MNELFNTPFETRLRIMLILYSAKTPGMTIDQSTSYDFMTIYECDLGVLTNNLHGIHHFSFSELSSKKPICSEGVKAFILDGLIAITRNKKEFLYSLTPASKKYVETLESNYKTQYLESLKEVQNQYGKVPDVKPTKAISDAVVKELRR